MTPRSPEQGATVSSPATRTRWLLPLLWELRLLPPRVGLFYLRALAAARRAGDHWSLEAATRPEELATLVRLAGRRRVQE